MAIPKQISSDGFWPFPPKNRRLALPFFPLLPQILPKDQKADGTQIMIFCCKKHA
jgi:hypothetical protein